MVCKTIDVINLNRIPNEENTEMNTVKLAHKLLNNKLWPNDLKLALIEHKKTLQSSDLGPIIKQGDDYTFQQQATVYNNLLKDFKEINDFGAFSRKIKGFYKDKVLPRQGLEFVLSLKFNFCFRVQVCNCCVLLQPVVLSFQFQFCSLPSSLTTHFTQCPF